MGFENHIWSEKHRPDTLDDVIGNEKQVDRLEKWVDDDSVPHVLLHGPSGTGKTASVVAFAKDKYGDNWRSNLIQMNASDDRGIDMVRNQLKSFAQQAPSGNHSYKIIYLDECDSMTNSAMNALRRIIEKYSDVTRWFLSCNYPNKIIDPIQSRCVSLPFNRLDDEEIESLLERILRDEEIDFEYTALAKIVEYVDGDARRAVQTAQSSVEDGRLTEELIDVVGYQVDQEVIEEMIVKAARGDVDEAMETNVSKVQPNVIDHSGFAKSVMNVLRDSDEIERDVRFYTMSQLGDVERNVLEGSNPYVQWNSFLASLPVINNMSLPGYD